MYSPISHSPKARIPALALQKTTQRTIYTSCKWPHNYRLMFSTMENSAVIKITRYQVLSSKPQFPGTQFCTPRTKVKTQGFKLKRRELGTTALLGLLLTGHCSWFLFPVQLWHRYIPATLSPPAPHLTDCQEQSWSDRRSREHQLCSTQNSKNVGNGSDEG